MRVGTRQLCLLSWSKTKDHPHACGDKKKIIDTLDKELGSSPCVWGQVGKSRSEWETLRIIPMRVGTRFRSYAITYVIRDHPHACGDKSRTILPFHH